MSFSFQKIMCNSYVLKLELLNFMTSLYYLTRAPSKFLVTIGFQAKTANNYHRCHFYTTFTSIINFPGTPTTACSSLPSTARHLVASSSCPTTMRYSQTRFPSKTTHIFVFPNFSAVQKPEENGNNNISED